MIYILKSNGLPPQGEISETGGLLSLRAMVEKENGKMKIESTPQVQLTISLAKTGKVFPESGVVPCE